MFKILFGSFMKVVFWIVFLIVFFGAFKLPFLFLLALVLLIGGPCVAIPAMIARNGKHVLTSKSVADLMSIVTSTFAIKKIGRKWAQVPVSKDVDGKLAFQLQSTKAGSEPIVSVDWERTDNGTLVHIWMSQYWMGSLNEGKGTPFWVYGSTQSLAKINEVAKAVQAVEFQGSAPLLATPSPAEARPVPKVRKEEAPQTTHENAGAIIGSSKEGRHADAQLVCLCPEGTDVSRLAAVADSPAFDDVLNKRVGLVRENGTCHFLNDETKTEYRMITQGGLITAVRYAADQMMEPREIEADRHSRAALVFSFLGLPLDTNVGRKTVMRLARDVSRLCEDNGITGVEVEAYKRNQSGELVKLPWQETLSDYQ